MNTIKTQKGFTIIELMIAIALTGIILAAVYGVYIAFYKTSGSQDLIIEAQQNAKAGIALIERDLINAGLNAGTTDVFTVATPYSVEFKYRDPRAANALKTVKYSLMNNNNALVASSTCNVEPCRLNLNDSTIDSGSNQPVVNNVYSLAFTYYGASGNDLGTPADQSARNNIRLVKVSITTKTSSKLPTKNDYSFVTLTTQVHLRNMGAAGTAGDTDAPDAPTDVAVRDPQICGRLTVRWTKNTTDPDVAGYKIFYGTGAGQYAGSVSVSGCPSESGGTCEYTINPTNADGTYKLQHSESDGTPTITYFIAMQSFDNSGNSSGYSTPVVSGNPSPSNSSFASGSNDTTINAVKISAPTGFAAADGPANYQVSLSWTGSGATDLAGYRIYRDTSPFTAYPIDAAKQIACESGCANVVGKTATSFTDTTAGLIGCQVYYYAIAAVNCDGTLVTDDAGDDDTKRYIASNYAVTYGDGGTATTQTNGEAGVADSPAASDTAPPDTVAPSSPTGFGARAGWKRVAVSLTQPSDNDLDRTCAYANQGASYPTLQTDTGAYPRQSGCYQVDAPGARAYGSPSDISTDGILTVSELSASSSKSYWHNSMAASTDTPSLSETGTYSYRAVAFDKCGNASNITAAQAEATLCGEDPAGKPSEPAAPSASACSSPVTIGWTAVSSIPGLDPNPLGNHPDLAGYRIFRSTSSADWSGAVLLNPDAPLWGTSWSDTGMSDGGEYYYRIASTDCPYEKGDDTGGTTPTTPQMTNHMSIGFLSSAQVGPVFPGKIDRDEKTTAVQDSHLEVLTGKDAKIGSSEPTAYDYYHNTVTLYFENTSSGTVALGKSLVITGIDQMSWDNTSACLKKITIGGSPSTQGTSQIEVYNAVTCANPTGAIDFIDKEIQASDRHVPITFEFTKTDGTIDNTADMRNSNVRVKLKVANNSTSTTSCNTYLTYSGGDAQIYVPSGPRVDTVLQDKPSSLTTPYEATGSNNPYNNSSVITVAGGSNVNVTITTADGTYDGVTVPIDSAAVGSESDNVILYYTTANCYHDYTDTACKAATQYTGANYTAIKMFKTAANTYSLHRTGTYDCAVTPTATHADDRRIPAQASAKRIWYFIVIRDTEGNFDRAPEVVDTSAYYTAYTYDQGVFDKCSATDATPNAPTGLQGADLTGTTARLSWTAPTQYTGGGCINNAAGGDPISYKVYKGSVVIPAGDAACDGTIAGLTCDDTGLASGVYNYQIKAINSCAAPIESALTDITAVCVGASGSASLVVSGTDRVANPAHCSNSVQDGDETGVDTGGSCILNIYQGDSYNVAIVDCLAISGARAATIEEINTTAGFTGFTNTTATGNSYNPTITETGAGTGTFNKTIETSSSSVANKLWVGATDTVTVFYPFSTPQSRTIGVISNPCGNTPNAPTGLNLRIDGASESARANNTNIHVRFTAPQANTDASNLSDLDHYKLEVLRNGSLYATVNVPLSSCTSSLADPAAGATCDYTYNAGDKMKDYAWSFKVYAVDNCSTGGNESSAAGPLQENCTATNNCAATY